MEGSERQLQVVVIVFFTCKFSSNYSFVCFLNWLLYNVLVQQKQKQWQWQQHWHWHWQLSTGGGCVHQLHSTACHSLSLSLSPLLFPSVVVLSPCLFLFHSLSLASSLAVAVAEAAEKHPRGNNNIIGGNGNSNSSGSNGRTTTRAENEPICSI